MPAHILIVDDDPEVLDVLKELIASLGYEVSTATSGLQALEALSALQPDAMVTDLTMPAMSGGQLLDRVKVVRPQLPVIVAAASSDPAVVEEMLARGAFAYIGKPFELERLAAVLASALRTR